jgi:muramoyltetrapeptide carboxypeptidase
MRIYPRAKKDAASIRAGKPVLKLHLGLKGRRSLVIFVSMKNLLTFPLLFLAIFQGHAQARKTVAPAYLQKGDTVAIVATARKIELATIQPAITLLKSWGLNVVVGKTIGKDQDQLAGPDWQRATDLQEMLDDPKIKAVWAAKGGYGTVRIIDRIDFTKFKKKPKWIVGFSDVTVLHSQINTMGIQTLHAIMAISAKSASPDAIESMRKSLFGQKPEYHLDKQPFNRNGKAKGELIGGNLSVLYSIMGSKSETSFKGKILFIEDLDEYLYHIDRMMMNLKRNGYFDGIQGLIIGGMTEMNDNDIPWGKTAYEIIQDVVKDYKFPVIYNFPAGHSKDNRALILGSTVSISVDDSGAQVRFE